VGSSLWARLDADFAEAFLPTDFFAAGLFAAALFGEAFFAAALAVAGFFFEVERDVPPALSRAFVPLGAAVRLA